MIVGWQTVAIPQFLSYQPFPTLASTASLTLYQTQTAVTVEATQTKMATAVLPIPTPTSHATLAARPSATPIHTTTPFTPSPTVTTSPSPTSTPTSFSTPAPTEPPSTPTAVPSPTPLLPLSYPDITLVSGQPQGYLDKFRLFAYYGSPTGPGLGILGNQSRSDTLIHLRQTMSSWQPYYEKTLMPTYHMVTTVANPHPPEFRHQVSLPVIQEWIESAEANGVAVILDIQPGHADLMAEYYRVRQFLYEPHVHLAIDPEFVMAEGQIPLVDVGQLYASPINDIQADMNNIGYEIGLNRVLIIHQFKDSMIPDKNHIQAYPFVELLINGDGVGPPGAKIRNYNQYANEPGFEYGGFKLFPWHGDNPVMTPEWVMEALNPQPVLIIIQ